MPRGYLKHSKHISKKEARGGSSGRGRNAESKHKPPRIRSGFVEDFAVDSPIIQNSTLPKPAASPMTGECCICFEERQLVYLSTKCKWHGSACYSCLRRLYVADAQKSVTKYPLTCFNPLCDNTFHTAQLEKHSIFKSSEELKRHHHMLVHARIQKIDGMRTVHCPHCDTPRGIKGLCSNKDHRFGCINCGKGYLVSPHYSLFRALDNMKKDKFGKNDGWAQCPSCGVIISKGDGCDHMVCFCGHEFYWDEVLAKKETKLPHARVPDQEIYLWW